MQTILTEKEELADGMPRDARGFWQPEDGTADPNPWLAWPLKPKEALIWLKDYIYPWNLIYAAIATLTWYFLTPDLTRTAELRWGLDIAGVSSQPGDAVRHCERMAHLALDQEITGTQIQVHLGLDGIGEAPVPVEQPGPRQRLLELCQRRHYLDCL